MSGASIVTMEERPLLGGFAPLVVAVVLLALGVLLVPSVAPERVVVQPVEQSPAAEGTP